MSNKYNQNRVKEENTSVYTSQNLSTSKSGNYRFSYSSRSPNSHDTKIKNEKEELPNNSNLSRYSKFQNSSIQNNPQKLSSNSSYNIKYKRFTEKDENNQKISQEKSFQANQNSNHSFYVSEFTKDKTSIDQDKKLKNRSTFTLKNPTQSKLNEKYYIHEINYNKKNENNNKNNNIRINTDYNINKSRYNNENSKNNFKERKTTTHVTNIRYEKEKENKNNEQFKKKEYTNKSYQGNKFPPKYYRNNPLIRSYNDNNYLKNKNYNKNGNNIIRLVAQKICNIYIKPSPKYIKKYKNKIINNIKRYKKNIEYEEENDINIDLDNYNNEYEDNDIERDEDINYENNQNISDNQYTRNKTKSYISKNINLNKSNKYKIQKLKNSNFELKKTPMGQVIEMQKAQSFEQPRDFNYISTKPKNKNNRYQVTQLKDCKVDIVGKSSLSIDNIPKNKNNYQDRKNQFELTSIPIPKPEIIKNRTDRNNINNYNEDKIPKISHKKTNINFSTNFNDIRPNIKKLSKPITIVMNKRSNSSVKSKIDSVIKREEELQNKKTNISNTNIMHTNKNKELNSNKERIKENEKEKENKINIINIPKNNIKIIPNSSKIHILSNSNANDNININVNTNIQKVEPEKINSRRNNHITFISSSNDKERSKSYQRINYIKSEPSANNNKNITTIFSSKQNTSLTKDKNEKEKENEIINIKTDINIDDVKNKENEKKSKEKIESYYLRKNYTFNSPIPNSKDGKKNENIKEDNNNIKIEIINTDINISQKPVVNTSYHRNGKNKRKYSFSNKENKEIKDINEYKDINENKEKLKKFVKQRI